MRNIAIPEAIMQAAVVEANDPVGGAALVLPVRVDWPELRLTEEQVVTNAIAVANGQEPPFPDRSVFTVRLPIVVVRAK